MTKNEAKELLLTLLYPKIESDSTDEEEAVLDDAAQCQADYTEGGTADVKSESVGDVSVTYSCLARITLCGVVLSPAAYAKLISAGLVSLWV